MRARDVADKLVAKGYTVSAISEPDSVGPGQVHVRSNCYVEVPAEGDALYVVMTEPDGEVVYGRPRSRFAYVLKDISCVIYQGWPRP